MPVSKGQLFSWLLSIAGHLPFKIVRGLGRGSGLLSWFIPNRSKRTTLANIALCMPELSVAEQRRMARQSLQHTGMLVFEMAFIWCRPEEFLSNYLVDVINKDAFDRAQTSGRGVILLMPHQGNWEVFSEYLPTVCNIRALYEPVRIPELERHIKHHREKSGAQMFPTNQRGIATLLKHLRGGGVTGILPDQVPSLGRGRLPAPFFGELALTMTLVHQLTQKTNCMVLAIAAKRVENGFVIKFYNPPQEIYSSDAFIALSAMNTLIEKCVREAPEQYQWEYKRYKGMEDYAGR